MNFPALLLAIAFVESRNNDLALGKHGEVSRYQIRPYVWHQYTKSKAYTDPRIAELVCLNHLLHIMRILPSHARTERDVLVVYNWGIGHYARVSFNYSKVPQVVKNYVNKILTYESKSPHPTLQRSSVSTVRSTATKGGGKPSTTNSIRAKNAVSGNRSSTLPRRLPLVRGKQVAVKH